MCSLRCVSETALLPWTIYGFFCPLFHLSHFHQNFSPKRNSTVSNFRGVSVRASWSSPPERRSIGGDSARDRSLSRQPPYCPNSVSTCIGTENLRSHTEPVSSAASTTLAFSFSVEIGWYHVAILDGCGIISKFYQNSIPSCFPVFGSCLEVHLLNPRE